MLVLIVQALMTRIFDIIYKCSDNGIKSQQGITDTKLARLGSWVML